MPKAPEYPLVLRGEARVLIAGGGAVAAQKLKGLPRSWKLTVVSPSALAALKRRGRWIKRKAKPADVDAADLIFAATNDSRSNAALAKRALKMGKLVCVVDNPILGNFSVPALARAGRLSASISTGGASPALAKALRLWLEARLKKPALQRLLRSLGQRRAEFKKNPQAKAVALAKLKKPRFLEQLLR
jgi:precorrin-2 dehydrogenase/sirohydrochlorin ferrochelatase